MSDRLPSNSSEEDFGMLLATSMLSVGVDLSRVGLLHSAAARLRDLADPWLIVEPKTYSRSLPEGLEIGRYLLRTAEEASGSPCSVSSLLHEQAPTPAACVPVMIDGQHRLTEVMSVIRHAAGSGKTATMVLTLADLLSQRVGRVNRHGHRPTAAELGGIADAAQALSTLLLLLAQRLLTGCFEFCEEVVAVPRTASSPCGLLRLAAPRVPRAPGSIQIPGPTEFALAA
ncbi:hypothetical protein [Streptomyces sp. SID5606]|uniref:hypothetical protein n=1 Tax=Streptomyces sp. SID5606 TaxID=2690305 RepID=UPI00136C103D|nr:hypothetical protein [Streptomyces sp. SID5606]MZD56756.1 hypothetical protein [Streptomyces sp. SID5606]